DHGGGMDVGAGVVDVEAVHQRVEILVIDHVVDVAVDVVVGPARRNGKEMPVSRAQLVRSFRGHQTTSLSAASVAAGSSSIIMWPLPRSTRLRPSRKLRAKAIALPGGAIRSS